MPNQIFSLFMDISFSKLRQIKLFFFFKENHNLRTEEKSNPPVAHLLTHFPNFPTRVQTRRSIKLFSAWTRTCRRTSVQARRASTATVPTITADVPEPGCQVYGEREIMGERIHSYFLLFYKLPQWDNHTHRNGDERSAFFFLTPHFFCSKWMWELHSAH